MSGTIKETNTTAGFIISKKLKEAAMKKAKEENRSFSNLVVVAIEEFLKNHSNSEK